MNKDHMDKMNKLTLDIFRLFLVYTGNDPEKLQMPKGNEIGTALHIEYSEEDITEICNVMGNCLSSVVIMSDEPERRLEWVVKNLARQFKERYAFSNTKGQTKQ